MTWRYFLRCMLTVTASYLITIFVLFIPSIFESRYFNPFEWLFMGLWLMSMHFIPLLLYYLIIDWYIRKKSLGYSKQLEVAFSLSVVILIVVFLFAAISDEGIQEIGGIMLSCLAFILFSVSTIFFRRRFNKETHTR